MAKNQNTFEKRRREQARQERNAAKRADRAARAEAGPSGIDESSEAELWERFRVLNERRAAGQVDDASFEAQRRDIFVALGLEEPES